jgi:NAD(P)H-dependent FMN reductase
MARNVLLISGSLRAQSTNTAVLRTAAELAPLDVECTMYGGMVDLPPFNPDYETNLRDAVIALRRAIHEADGLLFCTPEYAGALPGSLKNLLDWTIGDDAPRSIYEKRVAWINSSPRGAEGAHRELRVVLSYAHATIVEEACVQVEVTAPMVGPDRTIADPDTRRSIAASVELLAGPAC